jgi:hypothetical protein
VLGAVLAFAGTSAASVRASAQSEAEGTAALVKSTKVDSKSPNPRRVFGFGGLGLGYGPTLHAYRPAGRGGLKGPDTYMGFAFALEAGVMIERAQLMLEWAPGTFEPLLRNEPPHIDAGRSFYSVIGSVGYYIPVTDVVSWPLRIGAGVASDRHDLVARVDLINVAVKLDHVVIEASLPSIRYMSDFDTYHRWTGLFGLSGVYSFP